MKFTFANKSLAQVPKGYTPVFLKEDGETRLVEHADKTLSLQIGIPKRKEVTVRKFIVLCREVVKVAKEHKLKKIAVQFDKTPFPLLKRLGDPEVVSLMAQNFEMANYEFVDFKTKPKGGWSFVEEVLVCGNSKTPAAIKDAFRKGQLIGVHVNDCRTLSNTPGGDMTPAILASEAKKVVRGVNSTKVTVLGERELKKLGAGGVLGVARGSTEEPKFIIMEYRGGGKEKPIVLVGKGVTFDTGGINLKPSEGISDMYLDMSGGAAVIHTVALISKLKVKKNVIGLIPAVENMPSGSSYRPGDVLKSLSGKTIEVLNTDAEGRIILADALTYAKRYNPRLVIDVATLTGAALVALGVHASALMTKDEKLQALLVRLGEESGDYVWPLPLWEVYERYTKGTFGDVPNLAPVGNARYAGSILGGMFLYEFVKHYPKETKWAHLDIAPRMTNAPGDHLAKGAAGEPVRLLTKLIEQY